MFSVSYEPERGRKSVCFQKESVRVDQRHPRNAEASKGTIREEEGRRGGLIVIDVMCMYDNVTMVQSINEKGF